MGRIKNTTRMMVVKKINDTWVKDGKTEKSCKLIILQDDTTDTFSCSEDILAQVEEYKEYDFITTYNKEYKSFRIAGLLVNNK